MTSDNPFNQKDTGQTFQGRKQFASKYKQVDFEEFIKSISAPEEWIQWKMFVEGELVTTKNQLDEAVKVLKPGNVFMVDQVNKHMHYMNRATYDCNIDQT